MAIIPSCLIDKCHRRRLSGRWPLMIIVITELEDFLTFISIGFLRTNGLRYVSCFESFTFTLIPFKALMVSRGSMPNCFAYPGSHKEIIALSRFDHREGWKQARFSLGVC